MFHKVQSVKILPDYKLAVGFADGGQKEYDVKPLCEKWDAFRPLLYVQGLFELVQIEAGGYGISWNSEIDLSCEELYKNGICK